MENYAILVTTFNGSAVLNCLKKGYTPETSVSLDNFDTCQNSCRTLCVYFCGIILVSNKRRLELNPFVPVIKLPDNCFSKNRAKMVCSLSFMYWFMIGDSRYHRFGNIKEDNKQ